MRSPAPSPIDPEAIQGAIDALQVAHATFLNGLQFEEEVSGERQTGVHFEPSSGESILFVNFDTPLAQTLKSAAGGWKEAWILILAHESGHLRLNALCNVGGTDPRQAENQLRAIGMDPASSQLAAAADFQKECSIEAFCDACLAEAAVRFLGPRWRSAVGALRDHRAAASKTLGLFQGDEYATAPALDAFLASDGKTKPMEAARIALEEAVRSTPALKKIAVLASTRIEAVTDDWMDRFGRWRILRNGSDSNPQPSKGPKPK